MTAPFPPRCAARFRPVQPIGEGAYGLVWRADDLRLSRPAVVKLFKLEGAPPGEVSRFGEEARITAALSHPHVVRVLDADVEDEQPWIAYELLEGPTLRDRLDDGPLPISAAIAATAAIASGVAEAHRLGILHRDLKPANVLSTSDGVWKVADFGLAKWTERPVLTATGAILGTPRYIAPEQVQGDALTPRCDVYALGIMLFELLTGVPPYTGSVYEILQKHCTATVPPPSSLVPGVPPWLDRLVASMTARSPESRPDLPTILTAIESAPTPRRPSRAPRPRPPTLLLLPTAVTALALAYWSTRPPSIPPARPPASTSTSPVPPAPCPLPRAPSSPHPSPREAIARLNHTLARTPDDLDALLLLPRLYLEISKVDAAGVAVIAGLQRHPESPALHALAGEILERRGDLPSAELQLRDAVARAPADAALRAQLTDFLRRHPR